MTKTQAEQLARECDAIIAPSQFGLPRVEQTEVNAMPYRPMRGWIVRFETGKRRTTITELIPAQNAVAIHKRSL